MATSWFGLSSFFKRKKKKKKIRLSVLVKSKCWKSKITCQGGKCCHWQSSIPQIPRPNESLKRLAFGAKSCLLPEKGFLNRTDCKLKIRSTVTYIPSFLLLNLDHIDGSCCEITDRTWFCPSPSLEDPPSIHMASKFDRKMCLVLRRVQEMWRTACPHHGHKYNKTLWVLTVPQYKLHNTVRELHSDWIVKGCNVQNHRDSFGCAPSRCVHILAETLLPSESFLLVPVDRVVVAAGEL